MSIVIGCVEKLSQNGVSVNTSLSQAPFFPVQNPNQTVQMDALLKGELVLVNGCLRVDNYLLVWPYVFSISSTDGEVIQIIDNTGKPFARVGDKVNLGGGEMSSEFIAQYSAELPNARCSGPYWIVSKWNQYR